MDQRADGTPDVTTVRTFATGAIGVVNLQFGPDGSLYYPDLNDGTIKRIAYNNHGPVARASATPTSGLAPLDVEFDGTASTDPDGDALSYAWDLDGDGEYDDSTAAKPSFRYETAGRAHRAPAGDRRARRDGHDDADGHRRARRRRCASSGRPRAATGWSTT